MAKQVTRQMIKQRAKQAKKTAKVAEPHQHADHSEDLMRLKRIKGQLDGIERMIQEGRYCMDIVAQVRSAMAALRSVEGLVMERHIRHCVKDAIHARDERETETKISELLEVFNKR